MIQIYKDFFIDADSNCFMLKKRTKLKKRTSQEEYDSFQTLGYYSSIDGVYKGFVRVVGRETILDEDVKTIEDFIEKMNDVLSTLHYTVNLLESLKTPVHDDDEDEK